MPPLFAPRSNHYLGTHGVPTLGETKANVKYRFGYALRATTLFSATPVWCHSETMALERIRSAGVTASAALAMMVSVATLLLWGWMFVPLLSLPQDANGKYVYQTQWLAFSILALLPPVFVAVGVRTSIGLFQLKPWARRAAMLMASIGLVLSLTMIAMRPFETFFIPERFVSEVESLKQLLAIAFVFMLLPISVWWLFFFRFKGVKAQFES